MLFAILKPTPATLSPEDLVVAVTCTDEDAARLKLSRQGERVVAVHKYHSTALLLARTLLRLSQVEAKLATCPTCKTKQYEDTVLFCHFCGLSICPSKECELMHGHFSRVFKA